MNAGGRPLAGWIAIVAGLSALGYANRWAGGKSLKDPVYTWTLAVNGVVLLAIVLGLVLVVARHDRRGLLALRRPRSWADAAGLALLLVVCISLLSSALEPLLHAGREQGLTPDVWRSDRAAQFALNALVIVVAAPIVEELLFRGLGYSVLLPFGRWTAMAVVGVAFGLSHGLIYGLPILIVFGAALAYLRDRTDSVYPGMVLHAAYNAVALTLSVIT